MSNVVKFTGKKEEDESPRLHGPMKCFHCKHEWTDFADDYDFNECPNCGLSKGVLIGNMLKKDKLHLVCDCGCDIFRLTGGQDDETVYCVNCGHDVVFD